jgi:hypothetical protein
MKTISLSASVTAAMALFGVVACTIVSAPPPSSAPAATEPTAQPAATPPVATAEPAPTTAEPAASASTPVATPGRIFPGAFGRPVRREAPTVASVTPFGGPEKTDGAFEGLVYLIPRTTKTLPDFATLAPVARLFTTSFDIKSQAFRTGFPNATQQSDYFAIRYEGSFLVTLPGSYDFRLISDDGARVRVNNVHLVSNDGIHEATEKFGSVNLAPGQHTVEVEYFQADKNVALQLLVTGPDGKERVFGPKL